MNTMSPKPDLRTSPPSVSNANVEEIAKKYNLKLVIEIQTQNEASIFFHLARTKARAPPETWRLVTTQV